jgi:hypothetical protein
MLLIVRILRIPPIIRMLPIKELFLLDETITYHMISRL